MVVEAVIVVIGLLFAVMLYNLLGTNSENTTNVKQEKDVLIVKPTDEYIKKILAGECEPPPCFEWVNWGIEYLKLGTPLLEDHSSGNKGFIKNVWIIYEACMKYAKDNGWENK